MSTPRYAGRLTDLDLALHANGLHALEEAADHMSGAAASYGRSVIENWAAARDAEERLPSAF